MSSGIHSSAYQTDREQKRKEWKSKKRKCNICGMAIDYDAPSTDREHFQLDHIKSRDKYPELEFDPLNWAPAHASCNKRKSNGTAPASIGITSEPW
jgi:5-methylcytosine-specific restriction endonuclease McrA